MKISHTLFLSIGLLALTGCENLFVSTLKSDYSIRVTSTPQGSVATPPACPGWSDEAVNPFDNQPLPQFGCSTARNLADLVENPDDLVEGRTMGKERGVTHVGAIRRYDNNQARGLVMPVSETSQNATTTSPTASSPLTGDQTGAASASSSSSGAASPVP